MRKAVERGPVLFNPVPLETTRPAPVPEEPELIQVRIRMAPTVHNKFLEMCKDESRIPNRVLGSWVEQAVQHAQLLPSFSNGHSRKVRRGRHGRR
jgi:hypothetical protein